MRTSDAQTSPTNWYASALTTYAEWVERVAGALHETCRLEWQAIAAVDPTRQVTQHLTDAHYGTAHDLIRRLNLTEAHHDDCLHCAWQAAEAVLPGPEWRLTVKQIADSTALVAWQAEARQHDHRLWKIELGAGPTPAAALRGLTAALSRNATENTDGS